MALQFTSRSIAIVLAVSIALAFMQYDMSHAKESISLYPLPEKAVIHILRKNDGMKAVSLHVDNAMFPTLKSGEIISIEVEPGLHKINVEDQLANHPSKKILKLNLSPG